MRTTAEYLLEALTILERAAPVAALRLWREITGLTLRFDVEGEVFTIVGLAQGVRFLAQDLVPPDIDVRCDNATVLTLIDGKVLLIDCVLAGRLDIRGDIMLMPALSRASIAFAEGAVRSRAMRGLLEQFRAQTLASVL